MNDNLDCAIVQDLLPSYADGLCSERTVRAVVSHVAECPACAGSLRRMQTPEPESTDTAAEVNYLKKLRRRGRKTALLWGALMLLAGMLLIFACVFLVGSPMAPEEAGLLYASVSGNTVYIGGEAPGGSGLAGVHFSEADGVVDISARLAPKAFFNRSQFSRSYQAKGVVYQVRMGELVLWEDGHSVSSMAAKLYAAENPYVGDVYANLKIAEILRVSEQLGDFTSVLQTEERPYGWTLCLKEPITPEGEAAAREIMHADACMMMASIGNLHWVSWEYDCGGTKTYKLTRRELSEELSGAVSLMGCAGSATEMQMLMRYLPELWSKTGTDRRSVDLNICNWSETPIYGMSIDFMLPDGTYAAGPSVQRADGEAFQNGEVISFTILPEDMPAQLELSGFNFTLSFFDQDGNVLHSSLSYALPVSYGYNYSFYLTGATWDGFKLSCA